LIRGFFRVKFFFKFLILILNKIFKDFFKYFYFVIVVKTNKLHIFLKFFHLILYYPLE